MRTLGLLYSLSKHNLYLAAVLQRVDQAVIVIYGYAVNHSVPELFVKLDGRGGGLFKLGEHTADCVIRRVRPTNSR